MTYDTISLQQCPNVTGWNKVLTTDVQDINTSRKLLHMCSNVQGPQRFAKVYWQGHWLLYAKNLHAPLSLTCWSQGFPSGLPAGRFNVQAYLQVPQMTLVSWPCKHSRNSNKLDGTKLSGATGVKNRVKLMAYIASAGCIKEMQIYMPDGCLVW